MPQHKLKASRKPVLLSDVAACMQIIAPLHLAAAWDHVGLLSGPLSAPISRVLIALDLTRAVANEALRQAADLLICYHPPIFKPILDLRIGGDQPEHLAVELAAKNIWLYSPHTALDAAPGGTNDTLSQLLGATVCGSLGCATTTTRYLKLVTFVPQSAVEQVAEAVYRAGAGHIGPGSRYSQCSFRTAGTGTFLGDESARPAVGKKGELERVSEIRFETVLPATLAGPVVAALKQAHPYEEPAFDLLMMENPPENVGLGRLADLHTPLSLTSLALHIRRSLHLLQVQTIGQNNQRLRRLAVVAGSAGRLPLEALQRGETFDCLITGELKHHDMLALRAAGLSAICLGHAESEKPVLTTLRDRLRQQFTALPISISRADPTPYAVCSGTGKK
ncbi:MAG: Nif3-like dinuclear metal center hexameric protein [Phycisphaerae bacterium]|nr:Nif3-like dinuclear metal center hexameric protein [Phycisphaerae bacterium]